MTNGSRSNITYPTAKQACAACKHQRRRCVPDCLLAPYFPADRQKDFMNAQKLFGVIGLQKAVKKSMPDQRDWTMKSIIFQANARANDPVWGCLPIIVKLQQDIQMAEEELRFVQHQNQIFRAQAAAIQTHHFQVDDVLNVEDEFNNTSTLDQQDRILLHGIPVNTETEGSSSSSLEKRFPVLGEEGQPLLGQFDNQDNAAFLHSNDYSRDRDVNPVHHEQEQDLEDALFPFHKKSGNK